MLIKFKTAILYVSYILTNLFSLFYDAVNISDFTKSVGKLMVKDSLGVVGVTVQNV